MRDEHELLAELGEVPFRRYYGTVDATPLFLMLAGMYFERTGDRDTLEAIWPNIEAANRRAGEPVGRVSPACGWRRRW